MPAFLLARLGIVAAAIAGAGLAHAGAVTRASATSAEAGFGEHPPSLEVEDIAVRTSVFDAGVPGAGDGPPRFTGAAYSVRTEFHAARGVPEPPTLLLLALGLGAMVLLGPGIANRRRQHSR